MEPYDHISIPTSQKESEMASEKPEAAILVSHPRPDLPPLENDQLLSKVEVLGD